MGMLPALPLGLIKACGVPTMAPNGVEKDHGAVFLKEVILRDGASGAARLWRGHMPLPPEMQAPCLRRGNGFQRQFRPRPAGPMPPRPRLGSRPGSFSKRCGEGFSATEDFGDPPAMQHL
ncbi:hypothetical protein AAFF_G00326020 [Aldrovandia affinis]|uniref:Uncharacterized protein n=1 Tax=Aldrovandia affinis TaxID=143900 RepID=A0AAD7T978_9TELE|nr:hypothetical protein AAFF_G00326020 [Aldrovandia affinis]